MSDLVDQLVKAVEKSAGEEITAYLIRQRWFGAKGRRVTGVRVLDYALLSEIPYLAALTIVTVDYADGLNERYLLPLVIRSEQGTGISSEQVIVTFPTQGGTVAAADVTDDPPACFAILEGIRREQTWPGKAGLFTCIPTSAVKSIESLPLRHVKRIAAEQSNTSLVYDSHAILKLIRKLEAGVNPDCEILEFLTNRTSYRSVPVLIGQIRYDHTGDGTNEPDWSATVAVLQRFIPNEGDGWTLVLKHLEGLLAETRNTTAKSLTPADAQVCVQMFSGEIFSRMRRLGEITAGLHVALSSDPSGVPFRPEPITPGDVAEWRNKMAGEIREAMQRLSTLSRPVLDSLALNRAVIAALETNCLQKAEDASILAAERATKIRIHGDYHLGQVLGAGPDFTILDFEGEPARTLEERRAKACPLKDVAGMLRSFNYATHAALRGSISPRESDRIIVETWEMEATREFLTGYFTVAKPGEVSFLPASAGSVERLLNLYQLEKAVYELGYELNHRPDWIPIPLQGLRRLVMPVT